MTEQEVIKTERLMIRCFRLEDAEFVLHLLNTPGWLKFIGDRNVKTLEGARNYLLKGPMASYKKLGFGLYFIGRRQDSLPLGMCGFLKREFVEDVEIGFAFLPEHASKGYAQEAAAAVIAYAAAQLKLSRIEAITLPENKKSIQLLQKLEFSFEKKMQFPNETEEVLLFIRHLQVI